MGEGAGSPPPGTEPALVLGELRSQARHRNLRATLAYDGTEFHGWQIQPSVRTVQGEIVAALERILGEAVTVIGASRTDAGVHAEAQVMSFSTASSIGVEELARALNALTGDDLVVRDVREVPADFHARFSVLGKRYRYRVRNTPLPLPWERHHVWHVPRALDVDVLHGEAAALVGTHDFSSFQAAGSDVASPIRTLRRCEVRADRGLVSMIFEGDGFLRHMVRNIVGTLVEVGLRRRQPGFAAQALAARHRAAAGPTAPGHGLWLEEVLYPSDSHEEVART
ncbi:MAG: tRNA pseudouridine(38-40) synthase TruA [bacterium]